MSEEDLEYRNILPEYKHLTTERVRALFHEKVRELNLRINHLAESPILLIPNLVSFGNVGAMLRMCTSLGCVSHIVLFGQRKLKTNSAVGSNHYLTIERYEAVKEKRATKEDHEHVLDLDWSIIYDYLVDKSKDHIIIFLEQWPTSVPISNLLQKIEEIQSTKSKRNNLIFVVGHEKWGIPTNFQEIPNSISFVIPQYGITPSLNVVTALAMLLSEYVRT